MSKLMIALFTAAGLGLAAPAMAQLHAPLAPASPMSKDGHTAAKTDADAQLKLDTNACASLAGNAKDICAAEAKGRNEVAKADALAAYESTPKAREAARIARADANYNITVEKCDDLAGNRKDVCVAEAKAALVKGKADAKVDRVAADTNHDASAKQAVARKDANADKRDAEYKVAIEKCDALAGPAKDGCVSSAKVQFGKS
jgi:hypothetical protein